MRENLVARLSISLDGKSMKWDFSQVYGLMEVRRFEVAYKAGAETNNAFSLAKGEKVSTVEECIQKLQTTKYSEFEKVDVILF